MIEAASHPSRASALKLHLEQTRNQVKRLEMAMESIGHELKDTRSDAMRGLINESECPMSHSGKADAGDAGIASAAHAVEHYETANYGTAIEWADIVNRTEVSRLLRQTLAEEEATDEQLTKLAESEISADANTMVAA